MKAITYTKPFLFFWTRTVRVPVPDSFGELSADQLRIILNILHNGTSKRQIQLCVLAVLLRKKSLFAITPFTESLSAKCMLGGKVKRQIEHLTDWIIKSKWELERNPYPQLAGLYASDLERVSASEFMEIMGHFQAYHAKREEADLNKLLGSLYRTEGTDFDQEKVSEYADRFSRVSMDYKRLVVIWLETEMDCWAKTFPSVFGGGSKGKSKFGWFDTIKSISADDFGTIEQKENTPMSKLLMSLEIDMANAKKAKANV
ncbi:hypothetical protein FUAX_55800 (plasmid) [Fulvitalea axinellae]|uniref:Uncharacterized protein n=1 Tax=Fulvitalea axinellae TaxID=1182444 RepID=A0AAU9DB70_9BACT|nr:hypothetical protein FUAX_55800 [Fulvitalea axinellae]